MDASPAQQLFTASCRCRTSPHRSPARHGDPDPSRMTAIWVRKPPRSPRLQGEGGVRGLKVGIFDQLSLLCLACNCSHFLGGTGGVGGVKGAGQMASRPKFTLLPRHYHDAIQALGRCPRATDGIGYGWMTKLCGGCCWWLCGGSDAPNMGKNGNHVLRPVWGWRVIFQHYQAGKIFTGGTYNSI